MGHMVGIGTWAVGGGGNGPGGECDCGAPDGFGGPGSDIELQRLAFSDLHGIASGLSVTPPAIKLVNPVDSGVGIIVRRWGVAVDAWSSSVEADGTEAGTWHLWKRTNVVVSGFNQQVRSWWQQDVETDGMAGQVWLGQLGIGTPPWIGMRRAVEGLFVDGPVAGFRIPPGFAVAWQHQHITGANRTTYNHQIWWTEQPLEPDFVVTP